MKTGRTLSDLAAEIERQAATKRDFVTSTANLAITGDGFPRLVIRGSDLAPLAIGPTAHGQIATETGIPKPYYDRMLAEKPELLARNVNEWFAAKPSGRMVRTLDGRARALLSDKYRPLDNIELAEAALPALLAAKLEIVSCEMTDTRLYIKAVDPSVNQFVAGGRRVGDGSHVGFKVPNGIVCPALQITNSEVGYGSLSVTHGYLDNGCTNLMWSLRKTGMKKYHVGARMDVGDELYKVLSDETRDATNRAVWLQFRDSVKAALDPQVFGEFVDTLRIAAGEKIEGDIEKVVEVTAKKFTLTDTQRGSVLRHLIEGGDLSKFGLANAVTSAANTEADYDSASALEALGGRIIELPKSEWRELALAA